MKWVKIYKKKIWVVLLFLNFEIKAQSINGDTIYVDSKSVVAVRFPDLPTNFYTNPPDAPYNLVSLPTGFTIIARKKNTPPATLTVIENKRTHTFIIAGKKRSDNSILTETDYDYSSVKKLKERVKLLEERENKYNELIAAADKLYQNEDFENAKLLYAQSLGLLNKPWPKEQIHKINKRLRKIKRKRI